MCDDLLKCGGCSKEITKKEVEDKEIIELLNKLWHKNHVNCVFCEIPIDENHAHRSTIDRFKPACYDCHILSTHPSCSVCREPVQENAVVAFDTYFHHHCFTCVNCKKVIGRGSGYYESNGNIYDPMCWMKQCREKNPLS